jgi:hypothetical protein
MLTPDYTAYTRLYSFTFQMTAILILLGRCLSYIVPCITMSYNIKMFVEAVDAILILISTVSQTPFMPPMCNCNVTTELTRVDQKVSLLYR